MNDPTIDERTAESEVRDGPPETLRRGEPVEERSTTEGAEGQYRSGDADRVGEGPAVPKPHRGRGVREDPREDPQQRVLGEQVRQGVHDEQVRVGRV